MNWVADFIPFKAKYLALAAVMLIGAEAGILPIPLASDITVIDAGEKHPKVTMTIMP